MKRVIFTLTVLALAAAGGAAAFQAVAQRNYSALLTRGDNALRDDQSFNAIEAYSGAIALRPGSMLAYLRRGQTYQRRGDRGDLDAAARDFRTAARLDPTAPRPLEALGDVLFQSQQYARASSAYERFVRLDDRSARVDYKLALARYRDGDADGAIAALKDTLRIDESLADAHYLLGVCLREQGRLPDALQALEKAAALSPGMVPAREELADLYGALNRHNQELDQLQVIAGLDRDHVARQVADRPRPGARRTLGSRRPDARERARAQPQRAGDLPRARQGLAGAAARRPRLPEQGAQGARADRLEPRGDQRNADALRPRAAAGRRRRGRRARAAAGDRCASRSIRRRSRCTDRPPRN